MSVNPEDEQAIVGETTANLMQKLGPVINLVIEKLNSLQVNIGRVSNAAARFINAPTAGTTNGFMKPEKLVENISKIFESTVFIQISSALNEYDFHKWRKVFTSLKDFRAKAGLSEADMKRFTESEQVFAAAIAEKLAEVNEQTKAALAPLVYYTFCEGNDAKFALLLSCIILAVEEPPKEG